MHLSSASADFQRQQGFYRRCFPIGRTSPFLFAWLPFLKNRQFAHVKRKSTDKCAIGGGRNHRLSLQHGPATGLTFSAGWATSTKAARDGAHFCNMCGCFVKRLAKCTILCYYFKPKRKARNPVLRCPARQQTTSISGVGPLRGRRFLCKRSPYAFIRKNKRAFPPPHGAGWP